MWTDFNYLFVFFTCLDRPKIRLPRFLRQRYVAHVGDKVNLTIPFTVSRTPLPVCHMSNRNSLCDLFFVRANPNLWSLGQREVSPWTQRGSTSAAPKETASCSSAQPRETTPACMTCPWRWRASRIRPRSPFKSSVRKMLAQWGDAQISTR